MWGLAPLAEGIAGDMCPKADIPVSFHFRLHDPEVMDFASAARGFAFSAQINAEISAWLKLFFFKLKTGGTHAE